MTITSALRNIFRSDAVAAGTAVFPEILIDRIASDLKLEAAGRERGSANQPSSDATTLDSVENVIIDQVERYRREGLQIYEDHKRLYAERLSRVGEARRELSIASVSSRNGFFSSALTSSSALVNAQRKVTDSFHHLLDFRQRHDLIRPAEDTRLFPFVALAVVFLAVEAFLNSALLAQSHEFGLLGGAITAVLIAVVNIGVSGLLGWQCRWINSVYSIGKARGYVTMFAFVIFALAFNLMVGHFRDALNSSQDMERAAIAAIGSFRAFPLGVESAMSWLLFGIGGLVSIFTALKAYHSDDPYPGYSSVQKMVTRAHEEYTAKFDEAVSELEALRDDAVDDLREAGLVVHTSISGALDALYGQASLRAHLRVFLDQCNSKANLLLTQYRDANRGSRNDPAPAYFDRVYTFPSFEEAPAERPAKVDAEKKKQELEVLVDEAIAAVGVDYARALRSIKKIETLEARAPTGTRSSGEPSAGASSPDASSVEGANPRSAARLRSSHEQPTVSDQGVI